MQAFANAWTKACQTPGGVVSVPAKNTFLLSGGEFVGPCNGLTVFQIDGTLVASTDPKLDDLKYWITFDNVDGLNVVGNGVFNGSGPSSWAQCRSSSNCKNRPTSLKIHAVSDATISGITSLNSKMFHITINNSKNVRIANVQITAPADSPNTDGIHISKSSYVDITESSIGTGDDCVSIGDGASNVNISGVACGPGHGISIGSLGKYAGEQDVSEITVSNCNLTNTDNGLRIKTFAPSMSSNVVSDVTYSDIALNNVKNPIIIDQHYCPNRACNSGGESGVQINGVKFINVHGTSATRLGVSLQCSKTGPCQDILFSGLQLTVGGGSPATASCSNANSRFLSSNPSGCT
ncbi:galacturonan 1,4-alpha-galacturonidase [Salvia divinorum]|uniref:Galacturonan 1,4-alpha-galacturonidase n=1 Tax=Salvia divinorum TaxID=28513 RepID=A0ABD1HZL8_SALDI